MTTNEELYIFLDDNDNTSRTPRLDLRHELKAYRKQAVIAAKELLYGDVVIIDIQKATSIGEIERILSTARKNMKN